MYIIFKDAKRIRHGKSKCTLEFLFLALRYPDVNSNCQDLMDMDRCLWSILGATLPHVPSTPFAILERVALSLTIASRSPFHRPFPFDLRWSRTYLTSFENQSYIPYLPSKKKKKINNDFFYLPFSHFWGVCMYEKYTMYIPPLLNSFPVDPSDFLKLPWEKIRFPKSSRFFCKYSWLWIFFIKHTTWRQFPP